MLQYYFSLRQFQLIKCRFFIHRTTPYIHLRLDSGIEKKLSDGGRIMLFFNYAYYNLILLKQILIVGQKQQHYGPSHTVARIRYLK